MKECDNIIQILKETEIAIQNENFTPIKKLSDQTLHCASATGDPDNIAIAVIIYSLGKIFERSDYRSLQGWASFKKITVTALKTSINDLENNNIEKFRKDFFLIKSNQ